MIYAASEASGARVTLLAVGDTGGRAARMWATTDSSQPAAALPLRYTVARRTIRTGLAARGTEMTSAGPVAEATVPVRSGHGSAM